MYLISHTQSIINLILFLSPLRYMYLKKQRDKVSLGSFRSFPKFSFILSYKRCTASF